MMVRGARMKRFIEGTVLDDPRLSVAVSEKMKFPPNVGVPDSDPPEESVNPGTGLGGVVVVVHVMPPVPPDEERMVL